MPSLDVTSQSSMIRGSESSKCLYSPELPASSSPRPCPKIRRTKPRAGRCPASSMVELSPAITTALPRLNGDDLRRDPLEVRKATLASILAKARLGIRFNEHIEGDGPTLLWGLKVSCRAQDEESGLCSGDPRSRGGLGQKSDRTRTQALGRDQPTHRRMQVVYHQATRPYPKGRFNKVAPRKWRRTR
jgi:hypothetical protein